MKTMKRYVIRGLAMLVAGLLAAAIGATDVSAAQVKKVAEKTFDFAAGGEIVIESSNGRIVVEGWDRPKARIQVTREVRAPDEKQAEELLKSLRADIQIYPSRIEIESRYPRRRRSSGLWDFLGRKVASMDIHYFVQVPRATSLALQTSNGEIRVRGISSTVDAATTNGDVSVSGAAGRVEAETTNGEVELLGVSGSIDGSTTNGSVRAELRSLARSERVRLTTTNGNVTLSLPASAKVTVDATTTNGRVSTAFPVTVGGVRSSKSITGTIGGGGATVSLVTTNGSIRIQKSGKGS